MAGAPAAAAGGSDAGATPWWPVTTAKFVIMTVGTLGIYQFYWVYENWRALREQEGTALDPFWRTFFAPFTIFRLVARMRASANAHGVRATWSAELVSGAYLVANIAILFGPPAWSYGVILLIPLVAVQGSAAAVNDAVAPGTPRNGSITVANLAMLAAGAALAALAQFGTLSDRLIDTLLNQLDS